MNMNTSNESSLYSTTEEILLITSTSVNLVLGVPVNSFILWLILTGPAGTVASDFFTLNLSVCEMVFILLSVCYFIIKDNSYYHLFTDGFLFTGRPVFQSCICIERYMAVIHPVLFLKYKPLRYRVACSVLAWLVIIGVSLLYMLVIPPDMTGHYVYMGECLLLMLVMVLCSLSILRALRQPGPGETGRERDDSKKRRAFNIICLTMVTFLGTYFTWSVTVAIVARESAKMVYVERIFLCITVMTGFVQPLLYICQKTGKLPCCKPVQDA